MRYLSNFDPTNQRGITVEQAIMELPENHDCYFRIYPYPMPPETFSDYDYGAAKQMKLHCVACSDSTPREIEQQFWKNWLGL